MFPVFARAREKARQTNCLSNMKQLALGFLMYAQDYDEKLPRSSRRLISGYDDGLTVGGESAHSAILPYVKNIQIFLCPSQSPNHVQHPTSGISVYSDYGWEYFIRGVSTGYSIAAFDKDASRQAVMTELDRGRYAYWPWLPTDDHGGSDYGTWAHNDGQNVNFLDGHAKWFTEGSIAGDFDDHGYITN
ncbi:MAG: DUF1559 domain-containing protein [Armatimonadota bacterium]